MNKSGFTLAEVLITLGIVGVVAAMTIPSLLNNAEGKEYCSSFKKIASRLAQAATSNYAMHGFDYSEIDSSESSDRDGAYSLQSILANRLQVVSQSADAYWDNAISPRPSITYTLGDGMQVGFWPNSVGRCTSSGLSRCKIYVDVNGTKGPNKLSEATSSSTINKFGDQFALYIFNRNAAPADDAARFAMYSK